MQVEDELNPSPQEGLQQHGVYGLQVIKRLAQFCYYVFQRFRRDGCPHRAASLAFTTLLSLVPLMTVSFTVLTAFPIFQELASKIQTFIINNFVATSAQMVQNHLQAFVTSASKLSAIGLLLLSFTAVLMVFTMEQAFNAIWRVKRQRSYVSAFLMYWSVLTLTPILVGVALVVSTYLVSLPLVSTAAQLLGLKKFILLVTPYLSTFVAFTILYLAIPNCKVNFWHALVGGLFASILFEIAKQGFIFYITHFPVYRLLYGALAAVPIFLVWIYLSWWIILVGAEISAALGTTERRLPEA